MRLTLLALFAATAAGAISPAQKQGRDIYRLGSALGEPITIRMPGSDLEMPAARFACMGCHGYRGEGALEGGVRVPPIYWRALTSDRDGWNRARTPYTEELLGRAIASGLNTAGQPLHRAMPRFRMSRPQLDALVAYLRVLNTEEDLETGVTATAVRFGAAGACARSRIEQVFARVNEAGGVYGRRVELPALNASEEPFALLAGFDRADPDELDERMERAGLPVVGSLGFASPDPPDANACVFHFVPSLADQARTLALHVAAAQRWRRPVAIHPGAPQETAAIEGLWSSLFASHLSYAPGAPPADPALNFVRQQQADAILFLGPGRDLRALTEGLASAGLAPAVLAPALGLEDADSPVAPAFQGEVYLASPAREGQLPVSAMLGEAAAQAAVEALKRAGRLLSRPGFVRSLAAMRDAETGSYDGVPLPAGFKIAASGGYIVRLDPKSGRFSAVTGWLTPPR